MRHFSTIVFFIFQNTDVLCTFLSFQVLFFCHSKCSFFVIPSAFFVIPSESEESSAWMLHFAQHDKRGVIPSAFFVIPSALFCHSERERGIQCVDASLRLRSVQHDKRGVIPNAVRNPVWMLRYAQHDRLGMANLTLLSLSFKRRGTFRHRRNRVK